MTVVGDLEGCWGGEAGAGFDLAVKSAVVEPVDVDEGGDLDVVTAAPGTFRIDKFGIAVGLVDGCCVIMPPERLIE